MRLKFGEHEIDIARRELRNGGQPVQAQRQVFDVLAYLIEHRDRVVGKEELLDAVWGDRFVSESALSTRIKHARQALGDSGSEQGMIRTVHGVGYRFVAEVEAESIEEAAPSQEAPAPPPVTLPPPPRTHYADRTGAAIAYQTFGEGPDLVIINGFATNVELVWEHPDIASFLGQLGQLARVTLFDKRGMGCSERLSSDQAPSLETRGDDLVAVMDATGIDRATVLGTSEGGSLAVLFAASHPERVERLVLHGTWAGDTANMVEFVPEVERVWGKGHVYRSLGPSLGETDEGRRFLARYERQSATPKVAASLLTMLSRVDVKAVLPSIAVPTLVLHSTDDPWVPFHQAETLHRLIPDNRLVPLARPDHYLFSGDQTEVLAALRSFLTDQLSADTTDAPVERRLATILAATMKAGDADDNCGDGNRGDEGDEGEAQHRLQLSANLVVQANLGTLVQTDQDAILAIFDGPGRAIRAARALDASARARSVELRSAVHCAEIEQRGDEVSGVGVDLVAQLARMAEPGQTLVTRTVTDLVAGNPVTFTDQGARQLDGSDQPWPVFSVDDPDPS